MAITTSISDLPTPPSQADPDNFDDRADAFLAALDDLQTEINAWAAEVNAIGLVTDGELQKVGAMTDIGAALADDDVILVEDTSADANRGASVSRLPTYLEAKWSMTAFAKTLLDDADAATARSTLDAQQDAASLSEIGAALTDSDHLIVADASDSNAAKKSLVSRVWTYIQSKLATYLASPPAIGGTTPAAVSTSSLVATTADGGTIDGTVIGDTTPAAVSTSSLVATTADINGGTIDGTTIGGTTPAAVNATTIDASGDVDIQGFTQLGESSPAIKCKTIEITLPSTSPSYTSLATGLARQNILGWTAKHYSTSSQRTFSPNASGSASGGYAYDIDLLGSALYARTIANGTGVGQSDLVEGEKIFVTIFYSDTEYS